MKKRRVAYRIDSYCSLINLLVLVCLYSLLINPVHLPSLILPLPENDQPISRDGSTNPLIHRLAFTATGMASGGTLPSEGYCHVL